MEITFKTKKLLVLCNDSRKAAKELGQACAKKLRSRLDDLEACRSLEDMRSLPGRCHELTVELAGKLAVDLQGGMRLIFEPNREPPPTKPDGGLDWREITEIRVVDVRDYHD